MTGLIKHKLKVQPRLVLTYFFCFLPKAYSAAVREEVVVDDQGFELDSGAEVMAAATSSHRRLSLTCISNSRTEAQQ